jgi:DNA-binding transcriptional LysR family regulator
MPISFSGPGPHSLGTLHAPLLWKFLKKIFALQRHAERLRPKRQIAPSCHVPPAPANFFFWFPVEAVHKFLSDHAGVHIEFELTDERVDLLAQKIDVAFRVGRISDPSLIVRKIGWTKSILVASPDYLAARGNPIRVNNLADHDCITSRSRTIRRMSGDSMARMGLSKRPRGGDSQSTPGWLSG